MVNKTIIEIDEKGLDYKKTSLQKVTTNNIFIIIIIVFLILVLSLLFTLAYAFEFKPLMVLEKYKRIKKNINSWKGIIGEKTGIEINKGKMLYLTKPKSGEFQCLDMDLYYTVGRISKETYLPEFIKRGNSGPWIINKANKKDESALQFCQYLINKYVTNHSNPDIFITCGTSMYNELGYSGYFIQNSPCENAIKTLLINDFSN